MAEAPAYVILGRGRWARKILPIIAGEKRSATVIEETRQRAAETSQAYVSRLAEAMKASRAHIAWLCVAPGPHVSLMVQAGLEAGLHVIVEKPWYGSADRKSTRLNSSHRCISYAVFCLKKKKI